MKLKKNIIFVFVILFLILSFNVSILAFAEDTINDEDDWDTDILQGHEEQVEDPLEKLNRKIFKFNKNIDNDFIKPITKGYRKVVKSTGLRKRITNFFSNMLEPIFFFNSLLQGDLESAITASSRFITNSTVGMFGFFDVANYKLKVPQRRISFADTLKFYGAQPGPYIIIPFLGPSNIRDGIGLGVDLFTDPVDLTLQNNGHHRLMWARLGAGYIVIRSNMMDISKDIDDISLDEYAMVRSIYTQYSHKRYNNTTNIYSKIKSLMKDSNKKSDKKIN